MGPGQMPYNHAHNTFPLIQMDSSVNQVNFL